MRLVNTRESDSGSFNIEEFTDYNAPPYAILSHTWEQEEVSLQDMQGYGAKKKKGFDKITRCCALALASGFNYVWIDTCCIDKASSAELSEAINSMYSWYEEAEICYAYLADVPSKCEFKKSRWFTRGWTLQELIAPGNITFFDEKWKELGHKKDLQLQRIVSDCTRIPIGILSGEDDLDTFSVAQKMSWAAKRKTSRVEDWAYSLMGLFGVNMPLIYGERETSFIRLQEEIMRISDDHTIFAWQHNDHRAGLLATSPAAFANSYNIIQSNQFGSVGNPPTISSRGIYLELPFLGINCGGVGLAILQCKDQTDKDDLRLIAIYVKDLSFTMERFMRVKSDTWEEVILKRFRPSQYPVRRICIQVSRITRKMRWTRENRDNYAGFWSHDELSELMNFENATALPQAAENGDDGLVWLLLTRSDVDVETEAKDDSGRAALSLAAQYGHEGIVKMLLQRGALVDAKDRGNQTPLSWAATNQHHGIVKILLERGAAVKNDRAFEQMLLWAVKNGYEAIIWSLLSWGFAIDEKSLLSYLSSAAANGHENVIKVLLEKHDGPHARRLESLLLHAARYGLEDISKLLLDRGIGLRARDAADQTPLHRAAIGGFEAIVVLLLERGAEIDAKDEHSWTPLHRAAIGGFEAIAKLLLERGAEIDAKDKSSWTPLHFATKGGKSTTVEMLLGRGADLDAQDEQCRTPLHIAALYGRERIAKMLLERGADLEAKAEHSWTPLHMAVEWGKKQTVEWLLDKGADIEAKTDRVKYMAPSDWDHFETPLSLAALRGHRRIVQLLLERGAEVDAEVDAEDCDGWRPLWQRVKVSHPEIAELLPRDENQNHRPLLRKTIEKGGQVFSKLRHIGEGRL